MSRSATCAPGTSHHQDAITGYRVFRTDWSEGSPAERFEVASFVGADEYPAALAEVREIRTNAGPKQYGVIDTVYRCGCAYTV